MRDDLVLRLSRKQVQLSDKVPAAHAVLHDRGLQEGRLLLGPPDALANVPEAVRLCRGLLLF